MPIYEYECKECGTEYEELVPISATQDPPCPKCTSHDTRKKFSVFGSAGSAGSTGSSCGRGGFS